MKCPLCQHDNIPGSDRCAGCEADLQDLDREPAAEGLAGDFMVRKLAELSPQTPVQIGPHSPLRDAVRMLIETGRNCALVVEDEEIVGILTERDILMKVALDYETLSEKPVGEFMTAHPEVLAHDASLAFGLNRMTAGGYRHVPIQRDGAPLGVVSVRDILAYMVGRYPNERG